MVWIAESMIHWVSFPECTKNVWKHTVSFKIKDLIELIELTVVGELATHSSILAWRIPGMGEPGGLPSVGSHRVRHDWSDLPEAAAAGERSARYLGSISGKASKWI